MGMELLDQGQAFKVNGRWVIRHDGMEMTLAEWSKYLGINKNTLYSRMCRGWMIEEIIYKPVRGHKRLVESFFMALAA